MNRRALGCILGLSLSLVVLAENPGVAPYEGSKNTLQVEEEKVGIDKHHGQNILGKNSWANTQGEVLPLGAWFSSKPVVLVPVYYECPSLCGLTMNGIFRAVQETKFSFGKDYELVFVSISPEEDSELAKMKKKNYVKNYVQSQQEEGIHFLTGSKDAIEGLMKDIGFKYYFDERSGQFVHPSTAVVLTPSGVISQYLPGVEFVSRDLEFALMEASQNQIGSVLDHFFLYCYRYDPGSGKYGLAIMNLLRIFSVITVLILGVSIWMLQRRSRTNVQGTQE